MNLRKAEPSAQGERRSLETAKQHAPRAKDRATVAV